MTDQIRAFTLGGLWVLLWGGLAVVATRIVQ